MSKGVKGIIPIQNTRPGGSSRHSSSRTKEQYDEFQREMEDQ